MDAELKQHLEAMESRLQVRLEAVESRFDQRLEATESRLQAHTDQRLEATESHLQAHTDQRLEATESRLRAHTDQRLEATESRLRANMDRAAEATATDVGHLHTEILALFDRAKKTDANVTTCLEMLVRQSRWHDETDTKAVELLIRVNAMEKRLLDLEGGAGKAA